jgi:CRISPR-associated protein Csm5
MSERELTLTVRSPVFIWAGEQNNGVTPAWAWRYGKEKERNKVVALPESEVIEAWRGKDDILKFKGEDMTLLELWEEVLESGANVPPEALTLLRQHLPLPDGSPRIRAVELDTKPAELWRWPRSAGRPYLPGSSLKGALRTAWLSQAIGSQTRFAFSDPDGDGEYNHLKVRLLDTTNSLEVSLIEPTVLGYHSQDEAGQVKADMHRDPFRQVTVRDTKNLEEKSLEFRRTQVWSVRGNDSRFVNTGRDLRCECLSQKTELTVRVRCGAPGGLPGPHDVNELLGAARAHFKNVVERERSRLKTMPNRSATQSLLKFYQEFAKLLYSDSALVPLRLGFGAGSDSRTLARLYTPDTYKRGLTPRSRRLCCERKGTFLPLGWVTLEARP